MALSIRNEWTVFLSQNSLLLSDHFLQQLLLLALFVADFRPDLKRSHISSMNVNVSRLSYQCFHTDANFSHWLLLRATSIHRNVCLLNDKRKLNTVNIGSPMVCGWIWILSYELCVFYPWALARGKKTPTMGDSFYYMLQHNFYLYINFM